MTGWGVNVLRIEDAITEFGPMTTSQLCRQLGVDRNKIASVVSRMHRAQAVEPKRLYIIRWTYDDDGARRYVRPVYNLGDKQDATKPKYDHSVVHKRWYHKRKALMTANSVFNLATPQKDWLCTPSNSSASPA